MQVIRALYDYEARSGQELSFSRGDFFHVIGREDDNDWYEACNPALPDARGLVPVAYFQALGRTERDSADGVPTPRLKSGEHDSGYSDLQHSVQSSGSPTTSPGSQRYSKSPTKTGAMVYGIVMYEFKAERADELEASAGEAIIVIAQSNPEWFVAKPIGRLGGPGLIPVSFVEIRDMTTGTAVPDPLDAVRKAGVPKVEEWKKMAADYKNSSITLGKFETGKGPGGQSLEQGIDRLSLQQQSTRTSQQTAALHHQSVSQQPKSVQNQQYAMQQKQQQVQSNQHASKSSSQLYAPIDARIPRYCFAEDKYWFVIEAQLEDGRYWELSRYYEDFYDFQIALLTEFPNEAGNTGTQKRTLPYMPGPVNYVTDAITEGRLHNLDAYVKNLLTQPSYIAKCSLVRQFFAPREGDFEIDPSGASDEYRLSSGSQPSSTDSPSNSGSRQSSRNNLSGNGYAGLSAPHSQRPGPPTGMIRQASSLSQPSQTSMGAPTTGVIKVKMWFHGECIAIRVPSDVSFQQLCDRIRDRLKLPHHESIRVACTDQTTGDRIDLLSNNDLDYALHRNEKLTLHVELGPK